MKMSCLESKIKNNSINYLLAIENITNDKTLNSYFVEKCNRLIKLGGVGLPVKFKNVLSRCPKCLMERKKIMSAYNLISLNGNRNFIRKLYRKSSLTKFQRKYLKRCQGLNENSLVIKCEICHNKTQKKLQKPRKTHIAVDLDNEAKEIRKKKKKKDKFSGLSKDVVMKTNLELKDEKSLPKTRKIKARTVSKTALKDVKKQKDKMKETLNKLKNTSEQGGKKKGLKDFLNSISN